jgi:methylmalonyl-CoA epimerase
MAPKPEIRHVAIAVRSLETARAVFEALLGAKLSEPETGAEDAEVTRLMWRRGKGAPVLELIAPIDENGAVARFIRKRGEGVHHVTLAVPDLEATARRLVSAGARVVSRPSYYRDVDGRPFREVFLHPKDAHGVLFHLLEEA